LSFNFPGAAFDPVALSAVDLRADSGGCNYSPYFRQIRHVFPVGHPRIEKLRSARAVDGMEQVRVA